MGIRYTDEQVEWLFENCLSYTSYRTLTKDFNYRFGTDKSVQAIQQYVTKVFKVHLKTKKLLEHFTEEQEKWLIDNFRQFSTYKDLTDEFNRIFLRDKTVSAIRDKCNKQFGLIGMNNSGQFKMGNNKEQCPIGTIRNGGNGYIYIKVKDAKGSYISGYEKPYWLPIQEKIWIDHYGEIPEGKMVMFLDGNRDNLDIDNLYCIDRKISAIMASNKWFTESREHTLTAIKWCELFYAMKGE
jgi:hypothetical protein